MILAFTRLDLSTWMLRVQTLLPLALVAVVGIIVPVPGLAIAIAGLACSITVAVPFLIDERWRLDTFYALLPISRNAIVAGRALSVLVYFTSAIVVGAAITFTVALVRGVAIDGDTLLLVSAVAVGLLGVSFALQLPVLFRVGFARGRLVVYGPSVVIIGVGWATQNLGLLSVTGGFAAALPIPLIAGAGFALGVLGAVLGVVLAQRSYRRRDL